MDEVRHLLRRWKRGAHIKYHEDQLVTNATKSLKIIANLTGVSDNIFSAVKQLALSDSSAYPGSSPWIEAAKRFLTNESNLMAFQNFSTVCSAADLAIYSSTSINCWAEMRKLRIASLCSTCSGRGYQ